MTTESKIKNPEPIWQCDNIGAGFSAHEGVIKGLNLSVNAGEKIALLGTAQSGKALLLRCLVGLRPVREGTFKVFGNEMKKLDYFEDWENIMPQSLRRRIGVCLEVEGLLSNVSVREGMELLFRFKYGDHSAKLREGAKKIVDQTCAHFGLGASIHKRPNLLTSAERRLAGIARAFLSKPHVIVLENPSQNVGDLHRETLWRALDFVAADAGRTAIFSTEDWSLAYRYCPRWIVMEDGKFVFDGSPREFLRGDHELVKGLRRLREIEASHRAAFEEVA